jgi:hypothetical protein
MDVKRINCNFDEKLLMKRFSLSQSWKPTYIKDAKKARRDAGAGSEVVIKKQLPCDS